MEPVDGSDWSSSTSSHHPTITEMQKEPQRLKYLNPKPYELLSCCFCDKEIELWGSSPIKLFQSGIVLHLSCCVEKSDVTTLCNNPYPFWLCYGCPLTPQDLQDIEKEMTYDNYVMRQKCKSDNNEVRWRKGGMSLLNPMIDWNLIAEQ